MKYFLSNRVPGDEGVSLGLLLQVAFGRCLIEQCFHVAKDELGLDHYQMRGWRCIHRHCYLTQLSQLFRARVRQEFDDAPPGQANRLTVEQVRAAANCWLAAAELPPRARQQYYEKELARQRYHRRRNEQARVSHTKTRLAKIRALGIDPASCPTCQPPPAPDTLPETKLHFTPAQMAKPVEANNAKAWSEVCQNTGLHYQPKRGGAPIWQE